jgi:hypothetical protein
VGVASEEDKIIAKVALNAFSGKPIVHAYWDDNKKNYVDILSCSDRPLDGVTSYSTIGLSAHSIDQTVDNIPLGIEIVGVCASSYECFPNILGSCAFNIINTKYTCYPGAIFQDIVKYYLPNGPMMHILFLPPFFWEDKLTTLSFKNKKVAWLLAVPISDNELKYAKQYGVAALETLFEKHQIDIFDLQRNSVK